MTFDFLIVLGASSAFLPWIGQVRTLYHQTAQFPSQPDVVFLKVRRRRNREKIWYLSFELKDQSWQKVPLSVHE